MAALGTLCHCLTALDRRGGRRCQHDSWGLRQTAPARSWASPHDQLPFPLFLIAAVASGVLFVALLLLGQKSLCHIDPQGHSYCPTYVQPATSEETP
jgi:hypothetical protein